MAYGSTSKREPEEDTGVTIHSAVGGPGPDKSGRFGASPTGKQKDQQKGGGPKNLSPLQKYLRNDPTFQAQDAQYDLAQSDYATQLFGAPGAYRPGADKPFKNVTGSSTLGQLLQQFRDTRGNLKEQRREDLPNMESDYASRGLMNSGLFAKAHTDYQADFQQEMQELINSRQGAVTGILNNWQQLQHQLQGQRQNARMEAIRRRAASLGLGG